MILSNFSLIWWQKFCCTWRALNWINVKFIFLELKFMKQKKKIQKFRKIYNFIYRKLIWNSDSEIWFLFSEIILISFTNYAKSSVNYWFCSLEQLLTVVNLIKRDRFMYYIMFVILREYWLCFIQSYYGSNRERNNEIKDEKNVSKKINRFQEFRR